MMHQNTIKMSSLIICRQSHTDFRLIQLPKNQCIFSTLKYDKLKQSASLSQLISVIGLSQSSFCCQFDQMHNPFLVMLRSNVMFNVQYLIYLIIIKPMRLIILLLILLQSSLAAQCTLPSHRDFLSLSVLGNHNQLTQASKIIQQNIRLLPSSTYKVNGTTAYTIFNAQPIFSYLRGSQVVEETGTINELEISGGRLEISLSFEWFRNTSSQILIGTGQSTGVSDGIRFQKIGNFVKENKSYMFTLKRTDRVTFANQSFQLISVDPKVSSEDRAILTKMLNTIVGVETVRNILEEEINNIFVSSLAKCLKDEPIPFSQKLADSIFDYKWVPGQDQPNSTITFRKKTVSVNIFHGVQVNFDIQPVEPFDWQCSENYFPIIPLDPKVYGSTPSYVFVSFYKTLIRYGSITGIFNTELNQQKWGSEKFHFFARDLFGIMENLDQDYAPEEEIEGSCYSAYFDLDIQPLGTTSFNVSHKFICELLIQRRKILLFDIVLKAVVEAVPLTNTMKFILKSHEEESTFYYLPQYSLNKEKANEIVKNAMKFLQRRDLFGTNWPLTISRRNPSFMVTNSRQNSDWGCVYQLNQFQDT